VDVELGAIGGVGMSGCVGPNVRVEWSSALGEVFCSALLYGDFELCGDRFCCVVAAEYESWVL
jgi:hypothetical protein